MITVGTVFYDELIVTIIIYSYHACAHRRGVKQYVYIKQNDKGAL